MPNSTKQIRRLKNLAIGEISLVDKGAVPDSNFVVLSKRAETMPETTPAESEIVVLAKAMTEDQQWDTEYLLRLLADFSSLMRTMKQIKARLPEEVVAAVGSLKSVMFDEVVVEKVEDEDESGDDDSMTIEKLAETVASLTETVQKLGAATPAEPTPEPTTPVEKEDTSPNLDDVVVELEKLQSAKANNVTVDAMDRLAKQISIANTAITDSQTNFDERLEQVTASLNHATGRE